MGKILVILGPTATGKTDLALQLANKFQGELVSVDSRQVYRGLDIGTGKAPGKDVKVRRGKGYWEMDGVKVWMYDVVDMGVRYNVADYVKDADRIIKDIEKRGKLPILVGGTRLYLKALLEGLSNLGIPVDLKLRESLAKKTLDDLQKQFKKISLTKWKSLNSSERQNKRRLIRHIELIKNKGQKPSKINSKIKDIDTLKIGLIASRNILYKKVDQRVVSRIKQGMVKETKKLYGEGLTLKRMKELGLEYGVLADYLDHKVKEKQELIKIMQFKIHGFVRRQLTWFKKEKNINWFDITVQSYDQKIEKLAHKWYHADDAAKNRYIT